MMTASEMDQWILQLWSAAGKLRQAALPYADSDERVRAALAALSKVLDGRPR